MKKDPSHVRRFTHLVYPENTELCLTIATEKTMLNDASELIEKLLRIAEAGKSAWEAGLVRITNDRDRYSSDVEISNEFIHALEAWDTKGLGAE